MAKGEWVSFSALRHETKRGQSNQIWFPLFNSNKFRIQFWTPRSYWNELQEKWPGAHLAFSHCYKSWLGLAKPTIPWSRGEYLASWLTTMRVLSAFALNCMLGKICQIPQHRLLGTLFLKGTGPLDGLSIKTESRNQAKYGWHGNLADFPPSVITVFPSSVISCSLFWLESKETDEWKKEFNFVIRDYDGLQHQQLTTMPRTTNQPPWSELQPRGKNKTE